MAMIKNQNSTTDSETEQNSLAKQAGAFSRKRIKKGVEVTVAPVKAVYKAGKEFGEGLLQDESAPAAPAAPAKPAVPEYITPTFTGAPDIQNAPLTQLDKDILAGKTPKKENEPTPVAPAAPVAQPTTPTAPAAPAASPAPAATATPVTPAMIAPRKPMAATSFIQAPARQGVPTYTPNANRNFANKETIPEGQARLVANSRVAGRTDDASRQALQSVDMNAGNTLTPAQQASNERLAREASMNRATGERASTPQELFERAASGSKQMEEANRNVNAARARQDANPQAESEAAQKSFDATQAQLAAAKAARSPIDEFRIAQGGTEQMGVKEATRLMRQQEREDQQARLIAANSPAGLQEKKNEGVVEGAKVKAGAMVTAAGIKAETEAAKIGVSSDKLQEAIRHNQATEKQAADVLDLNRDVAEDKNLNAKELLKQSALRLEIYRDTQQEDVALKRSLTALNNAKTSELSKDDALAIAHQEADIYGRLAAKENDADKRDEYLEKAGKAISEAKNLNSKKPAAPAGTPATPASSRQQNPQTGKWWIFENGQWKEEG